MDSANLRLVHVHVQRPPHQQHERRMCLHRGRVMGRAPPAARGTGRCSGCGFPGSEGCSCFFSLSMVQFELINNTSRPMEKLPVFWQILVVGGCNLINLWRP